MSEYLECPECGWKALQTNREVGIIAMDLGDSCKYCGVELVESDFQPDPVEWVEVPTSTGERFMEIRRQGDVVVDGLLRDLGLYKLAAWYDRHRRGTK